MAEPFIGEIRIFPYNFAPRDWAYCNGQDLPISQNPSLFAVIGTTYGGDGRTTMGLPDLQGRAPMHPGNGPGLTPHRLGEMAGTAQVALTQNQIPAHKHTMTADNVNKGQPLTGGESSHEPADNLFGKGRFVRSPDNNLYSDQPSDTTLSSSALAPAGASAGHDNMQPYIGLSFCISLNGLFPPRS